MASKNPFFNSHMLLALFVLLIGYLLEHLSDHLSNKDFLIAIGLIFLSGLVTALVVRMQVDSLTDNIAKEVGTQINTALETSLIPYKKSVEDLVAASEAATINLQLSNPSSSLTRLLLTAKDISAIEAKTEHQVYVVTRDLGFDREIESIVLANLRKGVDYYYLHPEGVISPTDINKFKIELGLNHELSEQVKIIPIPKEQFNFPTDLVVYDPHRSRRRGYVRLPETDFPSGIRAVFIGDCDPLRNLSESLLLLIKQYGPQRGSAKNHGHADDPRSA